MRYYLLLYIVGWDSDPHSSESKGKVNKVYKELNIDYCPSLGSKIQILRKSNFIGQLYVNPINTVQDIIFDVSDGIIKSVYICSFDTVISDETGVKDFLSDSQAVFVSREIGSDIRKNSDVDKNYMIKVGFMLNINFVDNGEIKCIVITTLLDTYVVPPIGSKINFGDIDLEEEISEVERFLNLSDKTFEVKDVFISYSTEENEDGRGFLEFVRIESDLFYDVESEGGLIALYKIIDDLIEHDSFQMEE